MELNFSKTGSGPAIVVLHGLYGSGTNWLNIARELASDFTVYLPDQRNHGGSPHSASHTYDDMAGDLLKFCNQHQLESIYLIGHSMGGKAAITFTLKHPSITKKLICVDISPFSYIGLDHFEDQISFHQKILDTFQTAPISSSNSRKEIDEYFAMNISSSQIRKFLLKNLKRKNTGGFYWQLNIKALVSTLEHVIDAAPPVKLGAQSFIQTLFIKGELSPYITNDDMEAIPDIFPNAKYEIFEKSGHWLHAENPEKFIVTTRKFFKS